jgi:methylenetetrahydrofolate dehydrogenase (NADP+)/methenyltetrahydrofolate cyclohydrolase
MQLLGKPVADALAARLQPEIARLQAKGIVPTLGIIRLGEEHGDLAYEAGAAKRAQALGIAVKKYLLPANCEEQALLRVIDEVNADPQVHGVLLFRPLPKHLRDRQAAICSRLDAKKDVDCMTSLSNAAVFEGDFSRGFAPCTPEACLEILDFYGVSCAGKHAVVIGRSLVVGKPIAMLLLGRDATVTVCHTKTENLPALCRQADILVSAAGALGSLTAQHVREGQIVLDVSINLDERGSLAGDAVFADIEPIVAGITPVPRGVGSVTSTVLMKHVVLAASREERRD